MIKRLWEQSTSEKRELLLDKDWTSIDRISNKMVLAVICGEDQLFFEHHGFDIKAIKKAIIHNQKSKRKRGASTISQQTAKNVFLWPTRSWLRKGFEIWFSVLIEACWSKKRILEVYLNVAEWGDGIYGVEAAAQYYYHKQASSLNQEESAMLAAVLPSPLKYSVVNPSPHVRKRQQRILRHMRNWGGTINLEHPNTPGIEHDEDDEDDEE